VAETKYYTPPQAARILGLSRRRVTQILNEGLLGGEKSDTGRWRIPAPAVAEYLKERAKQPAPRSRKQQANKSVEEARERIMFLERRTERLTDSLSRSFTRLERLEERVDELEKELNRQSR
jgi:excisionase family DNA binding protein